MQESQCHALTRECTAFSEHLNHMLSEYEELASYLPLTPDNIFERLRDGIVLGYVLHHYYPGSINVGLLITGLDLEQMDQAHSKVTFQVNSNLNNVVNAAKSIKELVVVNLGGEDILHSNRDLVLGLLWQIFNTKFASTINLTAHPELVRLVEGNETLASLGQLKSEALLHRWFNYHLKNSGCARRLSSIGRDLLDSELYATLMHQISPRQITEDDVQQVLSIAADSQEGRVRRAQKVLEFAERLGCREFVSPEDIVQGYSRLNYAFTATIFNKHIGISLPSDDEVRQLKFKLEDLLKENAELTTRIQQTESDASLRISKILSDREQLAEQLTSVQSLHKRQLAEQQSKFDLAKDELAAEYRDSLDSAISSERRSHQDELWELLNKQKEARRQLFGIISLLARELGQEALERSKLADVPVCSEEGELDVMIKMSGDLSALVVQKLHHLQYAADNLRSTVAHKEKVNEIMGDKIREYTETVISGRKNDRGRRGSILKRIFSSQS